MKNLGRKPILNNPTPPSHPAQRQQKCISPPLLFDITRVHHLQLSTQPLLASKSRGACPKEPGGLLLLLLGSSAVPPRWRSYPRSVGRQAAVLPTGCRRWFDRAMGIVFRVPFASTEKGVWAGKQGTAFRVFLLPGQHTGHQPLLPLPQLLTDSQRIARE